MNKVFKVFFSVFLFCIFYKKDLYTMKRVKRFCCCCRRYKKEIKLPAKIKIFFEKFGTKITLEEVENMLSDFSHEEIQEIEAFFQEIKKEDSI